MSNDSETEDDSAKRTHLHVRRFWIKKEAYQIALKELESARKVIEKQERSVALISRNVVANAAAAAAKKRAKLQEDKQAMAELQNECQVARSQTSYGSVAE